MTEPSWRKPFGILLIIVLIVLWAGIVASASHWISELHWLLQLPIYLVAGIVWILPLKPLMLWMETGRWKV